MSLALTLPASLFAGYLLGTFAESYFHHSWLRPVGILAGFAAGITQILKELARDEKRR